MHASLLREQLLRSSPFSSTNSNTGLNVYKKIPTATGSSTTVSATAAPTPGAYVGKGCYTEPGWLSSDHSRRALSGAVFYDDAQTIEKCAASCASFAFFGLE